MNLEAVTLKLLIFQKLSKMCPVSEAFLVETEEKHRMETQFPWTSRWTRYPNETLHWLVVQLKYMSNNKKFSITTEYLHKYRYCLIIRHFSDSMGDRLKEFYCNLNWLCTIDWAHYKIHLESKTNNQVKNRLEGMTVNIIYWIWTITKPNTCLNYQMICIIQRYMEFLYVTANGSWLRTASVPTQLEVTEFILVTDYTISHPTRCATFWTFWQWQQYS